MKADTSSPMKDEKEDAVFKGEKPDEKIQPKQVKKGKVPGK